MYDDEEEVYKSISRCMTFTDDMYNATRDYYFDGTPYPSHVGVEGNTSCGANAEITQNLVSEANFEDRGDESEGDDDGKEYEGVDVGMDGQLKQDSRVNCFPGRPSNTLIVTNESPPIWFQPKEGKAKHVFCSVESSTSI